MGACGHSSQSTAISSQDFQHQTQWFCFIKQHTQCQASKRAIAEPTVVTCQASGQQCQKLHSWLRKPTARITPLQQHALEADSETESQVQVNSRSEVRREGAQQCPRVAD